MRNATENNCLQRSHRIAKHGASFLATLATLTNYTTHRDWKTAYDIFTEHVSGYML